MGFEPTTSSLGSSHSSQLSYTRPPVKGIYTGELPVNDLQAPKVTETLGRCKPCPVDLPQLKVLLSALL